jgi:hypothetical protein
VSSSSAHDPSHPAVEAEGEDAMAEGTGQGTQTIAAVLADVDGTLVTKAKVVTPRAIHAVKQLQERGVLFAITSGRPPRGMRMLVEPLGMKVPMAAFNGGIIMLPDMTVVDERAVPEDVAPAVIETIRGHGLYAWIYAPPSGTSPTPTPLTRSGKQGPSSSGPRWCRRTTASSTGQSRSSASATTTTWSRDAKQTFRRSSLRTCQPAGRSPTTSM